MHYFQYSMPCIDKRINPDQLAYIENQPILIHTVFHPYNETMITLVLLIPYLSSFENTVDPDQLVSD